MATARRAPAQLEVSRPSARKALGLVLLCIAAVAATLMVMETSGAPRAAALSAPLTHCAEDACGGPRGIAPFGGKTGLRASACPPLPRARQAKARAPRSAAARRRRAWLLTGRRVSRHPAIWRRWPAASCRHRYSFAPTGVARTPLREFCLARSSGLSWNGNASARGKTHAFCARGTDELLQAQLHDRISNRPV